MNRYKSRHHIGSRRAAEKIVTYNESIWPGTILTKETNITKKADKRKFRETSCDDNQRPDKRTKVSPCKTARARSECSSLGGGKEKGLPKDKKGKLTPVAVQSTTKSTSRHQKHITKSKTVKKLVNDVRPTFLRREASLNAQAKVNVLYDLQSTKRDQLKQQSMLSPIANEEDDVPLACLVRNKIKSLNKANPRKIVNSKLAASDAKTTVAKSSKTRKSGTKEIANNHLRKEKKTAKKELCNKSCIVKKCTVAKGKTKTARKSKQVISEGDYENWRHSSRMASLNAKAILEASYQSPAHKKGKKIGKTTNVVHGTETQIKVRRKEGSLESVDNVIVVDVVSHDGEINKLESEVDPTLTNKSECKMDMSEDDAFEALKRDFSEKNMSKMSVNTMTTLKPLPEPKMATGHMMMLCDNRPMMQSENTIHWTNLSLLQQSSSLGPSPVKTDLLPPTPQMPPPMHPQPAITMASYQCTPVPPIVPSSQFQSYTVSGIGSITNLPMMPGYRSAFSVPGYPSVYQQGFFQPAGPLIQALPDQAGSMLQASRDACLIQHPVAIRPFPQAHCAEQKHLISHTAIEPKNVKKHCSKQSKERESVESKASQKSIKKSATLKGDKSLDQKVLKSKERSKKKDTGLENETTKEANPVAKKKGPRNRTPWSWQGEAVLKKIPSLADEQVVERRCYPCMRHKNGDTVSVRDCVLICSGPRKSDVPYVAKVAALWENPQDNEKMMSVLWYYRPEHTDAGRLAYHVHQELFTSKHWDETSVACIEDKAYVLTPCEFARYKSEQRRLEQSQPCRPCVVPLSQTPYPRSSRLPPAEVDDETVFLCRSVYDFRQKRILKNPS